MDRRVRVYVMLDEDVFEAVEKARRTEKGTISRSDVVNSLLRKALKGGEA